MKDKKIFDKVINVAVATTVIGVLAALVLPVFISEGKKKEERTREIPRIETEWNEAVDRGIEPYEVSGIDRYGPYKLEYLNVDGDEDFDIERLNGGIYRDVSFQVSDIERASR